jgi:multisubunit Na+/H+ antiporter MnhB subunit
MILDAMIASLVLGAAGWTLVARDALTAVIGFVAVGLLLTLAWVRLGAVDVALTEAAIGAGATGLVLLFAAARQRGSEEEGAIAAPLPPLRFTAGLLAAAVGLALAGAVVLLPEPAPSLAAPAMAQRGALGLGNPVAAVLMGYRGLDTLLESVVLVFAVLAVWSIAPDRHWGGVPGPRFPYAADGPLALLARLLPPIGIVIGIHLSWTGADWPGGKFQGGTVLAAMWLLAWLAGLIEPPAIGSPRLRLALVAGPMVFLAVGLSGMVVADGFLAYPPSTAKALIVLIEAAMTVSVAAALALLVAGPPERTG